VNVHLLQSHFYTKYVDCELMTLPPPKKTTAIFVSKNNCIIRCWWRHSTWASAERTSL